MCDQLVCDTAHHAVFSEEGKRWRDFRGKHNRYAQDTTVVSEELDVHARTDLFAIGWPPALRLPGRMAGQHLVSVWVPLGLVSLTHLSLGSFSMMPSHRSPTGCLCRKRETHPTRILLPPSLAFSGGCSSRIGSRCC